MKNLVGNWKFSATYTYQSPEYATVQSGVDSNQNGDALDRAIVNPAGAANVGSGVTAVKNASGATVAYVANNSNARYIVAGLGALSNGGRNTLPFDPINNIDASLQKKFNINERMAIQFGIQAFNVFNKAQFTGGYLSDVTPYTTNAVSRNSLIPNNADFGHYDQYFPSNARTAQLVAKFTF